MKWKVDYSEIPFQGMKQKEFKTRKARAEWVEDNKDKLYYFNCWEANAKSKREKPIVSNDRDLSFYGYVQMDGVLELHYETGMECMGLTFYDKSVKGPPNPDYDPKQPESDRNFPFFSSYEGMYHIDTGDIIEIDGVRYAMIKDRHMYVRDGFRMGFYPQGFGAEEFKNLFINKTKVKFWRRK